MHQVQGSATLLQNKKASRESRGIEKKGEVEHGVAQMHFKARAAPFWRRINR